MEYPLPYSEIGHIGAARETKLYKTANSRRTGEREYVAHLERRINIPQTNMLPLRRFMTKRTISMIVSVQLFTRPIIQRAGVFSRRFLIRGAHPCRPNTVTIDWNISCLSEDTCFSDIVLYRVLVSHIRLSVFTCFCGRQYNAVSIDTYRPRPANEPKHHTARAFHYLYIKNPLYSQHIINCSHGRLHRRNYTDGIFCLCP